MIDNKIFSKKKRKMENHKEKLTRDATEKKKGCNKEHYLEKPSQSIKQNDTKDDDTTTRKKKRKKKMHRDGTPADGMNVDDENSAGEFDNGSQKRSSESTESLSSEGSEDGSDGTSVKSLDPDDIDETDTSKKRKRKKKKKKMQEETSVDDVKSSTTKSIQPPSHQGRPSEKSSLDQSIESSVAEGESHDVKTKQSLEQNDTKDDDTTTRKKKRKKKMHRDGKSADGMNVDDENSAGESDNGSQKRSS